VTQVPGNTNRGARWTPEPVQDDYNYPGWEAAQRPDSPEDEPRSGRAGQRAARLLLRRRHRSYLLAGGVVAVVAVVLAVVFLTRSPGQSASISDDLVTTFQPGELQQVPDSCQIVPNGTVQQYLPGKVKVAAPQAVYGKLGSGCFWTVDSPPVYRLLELNLLAYSPSGLATGDGSATNAAIDAYGQALQGMRHPTDKSEVAKGSTVTELSGLGNEAFSSLQVFKTSDAMTDVATVEIRFHNVVISAAMNGMAGHTSKGTYGPISASQLKAAALAFAEAALASLK